MQATPSRVVHSDDENHVKKSEHRAPASSSRNSGTEGDEASRAASRHRQARYAACLTPFIRHASVGRWIRYPHDSRVIGSRRPQYHNDLHSRFEQGESRRSQPCGYAMISQRTSRRWDYAEWQVRLTPMRRCVSRGNTSCSKVWV